MDIDSPILLDDDTTAPVSGSEIVDGGATPPIAHADGARVWRERQVRPAADGGSGGGETTALVAGNVMVLEAMQNTALHGLRVLLVCRQQDARWTVEVEDTGQLIEVFDKNLCHCLFVRPFKHAVAAAWRTVTA